MLVVKGTLSSQNNGLDRRMSNDSVFRQSTTTQEHTAAQYSRHVSFDSSGPSVRGSQSESYRTLARSSNTNSSKMISGIDDDSMYSTRTSTLTSNSIQPNSPNFHLVRHTGTDFAPDSYNMVRHTPAPEYSMVRHTGTPTPESYSMVRHTGTPAPEFGPEAYKIDCYSVGVIFETKLPKPFDPERVRVEAIAPSGRIVKVTGDGNYSAQFLHTEIGEWKVSLFYNEKYLDGTIMDICDPSQVRVLGLKGGVVGKQQEFRIDCVQGGKGEVATDIKHNGRQIITHMTEIQRGVYRVTYTPYDPGPYSIDVRFNEAEVRESDNQPYDPEERQRKAVFYTVLENVDNDKIKIKTSCDWEIDYMTGGPFVCHVTDGSDDIQVYGMNDGTICATPQLLADCSKTGGGHLTAEVICNNKKYPARITEDRPDVYRVTFRPAGPGIYKIHLNFNGVPVKGSPFIQEIDELELPMAQGEGLLRGMPNRPATFLIDPRGVQGRPAVNIFGPTHPVQSQVESQSDGTYKVYYTAIERGQHHIDVNIDDKPLEGSPYKAWIVEPSMVRVSGGWPSMMGDNGFIPLVVNKEKHIPFDATEAGPGELTAEVRGPTGKIPIAIETRSDGRNTLIFTPRAEGHHDIDVFWGGYQLMNSPYAGWATYRPDVDIDRLNMGPPPVRYNYTKSPPPSDFGSLKSDYPLVSVHGSEYDFYNQNAKKKTMIQVLPNGAPPALKRAPLKVILRGKGLKEAYVGKEAEFTIDGSQCTDGVPDAKMSSQKTHIPITIKPHGPPRVYKCTYKPKVPGAYLLYIKWNDQPLRGSPFKVNVKASHPAHRVRFVHNDIQYARVGKDVDINIDTRDAGPGKLITKVIAPDGNMLDHTLTNNPDGTRKLKFLPNMVGRYIVDILFNDTHIHGSPYYIDIHATLPTGEVRVWGPGIESGVLGSFLSHFWVEANGAGSGELRVKIMGPKGSFHVKMRKASKNQKLYQCFYNPTGLGIYTVNVMWSGEDIEGSPFQVLIARDQDELDQFNAGHLTAGRYPAIDDNGDVLY